MGEWVLIRTLVIGAGTALVMLVLVGIYMKLRGSIRHWISTFRMKSLFWKDRRKRSRKSAR
jgi:hypothetical protein